MKNQLSNLPKIYYFFFLLLVLTIFVQGGFILDIITMTFLWGAIASAWNISGGYAGQFSLGHAGFLGVGAYTSSLLFINFGISPWFGMIIGGIIAALFALLIGVLCFRLKGPFYTLATIAFAELVFISTTQLREITNGSMGIQIPFEIGIGNFIFENPKTYAILSFIFMFVVFLISSYIKNSKIGYYLIAMREDPDAASSLGINIKYLKLFATGLSAFLTAICGTFLVQYILFIEPANILALSISIKIAMIAIVGGMNLPQGPVIGAIILTPLELLLRGYTADIAGLHLFLFGLILLIVVLYQPKGLAEVKGFKNIKLSGWKGVKSNDAKEDIA
ncbi:branched-chain amino acid ABC transporter permease [Bacillus sp. EB106-08-02-XG196]|uniref:branched-chain amino acid ABC transporter permease n=1 Tax=Bacillus sp. EB106-08-02-XG196 TaxID=2737049 RepID=UPI0015C43F5B|nr:branched-chain amino acid ABC transporter permease [Bacillus sp. EB106-08-02-XG196]NWQ43418.1 branched-chain amino acid ABC transporter permease [Bacillus sp. EB106-08-02-XG196]